jgi:hypothetical protein
LHPQIARAAINFREAATLQSKIPCIVLVYKNLNVIASCLDFLLQYESRLAFHIIENASETTPFTSAYFTKLARWGRIQSYTLFEENITNNAADIFLRDHREIMDAPYVIFTDGDVVADDGWLDECVDILDRHPEVFCCTVRMDATKWPEPLKAAFLNYPRKEFDDYIEGGSGVWLCHFRGHELREVVDVLQRNGLRFRDAYLNHYARIFRGQKWVSTKTATAVELTRSFYYGDSEYRASKNAMINARFDGDHYRLWGHDDICRYMYVSGSQKTWIAPRELNPSRPNIEPISSDAIILEINQTRGRSCWFNVDVGHARAGFVNVGRYGFHSIFDDSRDRYFVNFESMDELPRFRECFANVYCYLTLGTVPINHARKVLTELTRWLEPGGVLRVVELDHEVIAKAWVQVDMEALDRLAGIPRKKAASGEERYDDLLTYWMNYRRVVSASLVESWMKELGLQVRTSEYREELDPNGSSLAQFCWFLEGTEPSSLSLQAELARQEL